MVVALKLSRKDLNSNQCNQLSFYPKRVNHCGSKEEESEEEISFDRRSGGACAPFVRVNQII